MHDNKFILLYVTVRCTFKLPKYAQSCRLDICTLQGLVESYSERSIQPLRSIKQGRNFLTN